MAFKPILATDIDWDKVKYPLGVMPKIDGVRGLNYDGTLRGRSLKTFENPHLTKLFSKPQYHGLDGELIVGDDPCAERLCSITSGATSTLHCDAQDHVWSWFVFDVCDPSVANEPYKHRYHMLRAYVDQCQQNGQLMDIHVVELSYANNKNEALSLNESFLSLGYEGTIFRNLEAPYKHGRSTAREGYYLRLKKFTDEEGVIVRVIEGSMNCNEAEINELGYTKRSTKKENMVPNGMIGSLEVAPLKGGPNMIVGAGKLTHAERKFYFENQDKIIGRISKYKHFDYGAKDSLRIPTHQSFRDPVDL